VVTTNVEHRAGFSSPHPHYLAHDAGEMVPHRLICAGAIPVGVIKNFRWHTVFHLQKAASRLVRRGIATDKNERNAAQRGSRRAGLHEGTLEMLRTKIDDFA